MTANVAHYLHIKENKRVKRLAKIQVQSSKVARTKRKREKLKEDTRVAKTEFLKWEGTYRKGMNLDDPYGEVPPNGNEEEEDNWKPAARTKRTNDAIKKYCEYCGLKVHATNKSKKCDAYNTASATTLYG
jgi:hypothetical protein